MALLPALLILVLSLATFALVFWFRSSSSAGMTRLERILAGREPMANATALALGSRGEIYIGTDQGLLLPQARTWKWSTEITTKVDGLAFTAADALHVAGEGLTTTLPWAGALRQVRGVAVAAAPSGRLILGYDPAGGLLRRRVGDQEWERLPGLKLEDLLTLAVDPLQDGRAAAGGLDGTLAISQDGGETWRYANPLQRTISSLAFDPVREGRLWAAAGGRVLYTDDLGVSWRPATAPVRDRVLVAIAFRPVGGGGPMALSVDGLLIPLEP